MSGAPPLGNAVRMRTKQIDHGRWALLEDDDYEFGNEILFAEFGKDPSRFYDIARSGGLRRVLVEVVRARCMLGMYPVHNTHVIAAALNGDQQALTDVLLQAGPAPEGYELSIIQPEIIGLQSATDAGIPQPAETPEGSFSKKNSSGPP